MSLLDDSSSHAPPVLASPRFCTPSFILRGVVRITLPKNARACLSGGLVQVAYSPLTLVRRPRASGLQPPPPVPAHDS